MYPMIRWHLKANNAHYLRK